MAWDPAGPSRSSREPLRVRPYPASPRPWPLGGGIVIALALLSGCALHAAGRAAAPRPRVAAVQPPAAATAALLRFDGTIRSADRQDYLGSDACVRCHPAEAGQQASGHARTLERVDPRREAAPFRLRGPIFNSADEISYRTSVRGERCLLQASFGGRTEAAAADYAFGSGNVGRTYVSRRSSQSLELRFSYYGWVGRWDYTPGLRTSRALNSRLGQRLDRETEASCFACHATALVRDGAKIDLDHSLLGIGCEACHGPGRGHVEAVHRRDPDLRMARLADVRQQVSLRLCGRCHRGQPPPGLPPAAAAIKMARMQGYALSLSACFRKGGVTCLTCHDPHHDPAEKSNARYNAICVSCHDPGQPAQTACPAQPRGDCVSCHMPEEDVGMPTGPRFRTHWIKTWAEAPEPD